MTLYIKLIFPKYISIFPNYYIFFPHIYLIYTIQSLFLFQFEFQFKTIYIIFPLYSPINFFHFLSLFFFF